jgi:hypothetical protein
MEYKDIVVLSFKQTKSEVHLEYLNPEKKSCSISDNMTPHPDLIQSLKELNSKLASEFHATSVGTDNYACTGFTLTTKGESEFVVLSGKVNTANGRVVGISSGLLPMEEVDAKIVDLEIEAFKYFFEDKNAQGKLDFKDKDKEEDE